MCIAGAIIGAAVIGAAGSYAAGSQAASATKDATQQSIAAQQQAQSKQQALNAPYAAIGTGGAIQQYENLLGIGPPGSPSPQATLEATPGYQFEKSQGLDAVKNAASAMGLTLSGNTLEGLDKFSTGLADTTFQQAVGNAENAVTIGQNAAAGTGAGVLQTGAGIAGALTNQGNTIAGIDANIAAGLTKSAGNAANQYVAYNTLQNLNQPDISMLGSGQSYWDASQNTLAEQGMLGPVEPIPGVTGP